MIRMPPTSTPEYSVASLRRSGGGGRRCGAIVGRVVPVGAPFPAIAEHVMEAPWVGRVAVRRRGAAMQSRAIGVLLEPLEIVAGVVQRRCASAAGVLPFRFRWQRVILRVSLRQPRGHRHRVVVAEEETRDGSRSRGARNDAWLIRAGRCRHGVRRGRRGAGQSLEGGGGAGMLRV